MYALLGTELKAVRAMFHFVGGYLFFPEDRLLGLGEVDCAAIRPSLSDLAAQDVLP